MIALQSDYLLFQLTNGESVPCSAEMITVEIVGNAQGMIAPELLHHAAASVFHYFKIELGRDAVTVGEFAIALEKALQGLGLTLFADKLENPPVAPPAPVADPVAIPSTVPEQTLETDMGLIALESSDSLELFFFPRLRDELRAKLRLSPRVLRFRGLRHCAKRLAGAQRWSTRCEKMQEQIVDFLRECLVAEPEQKECALVVE
jgi:hypothetical protein